MTTASVTGGGFELTSRDGLRGLLDEAWDNLLALVFDRPGVALLLLAALVLFWVAGAVTAYFVFSPTTDERLLRARGPRRWARAVRSWFLRRGAGLLAWPHVLIRAAQRRTALPEQAPFTLVGRVEGASLRRYDRATPATLPPVLLVHALVTHEWILDLAPGRSFVRDLLDRGHDVFMVTWEHPDAPERVQDLAATSRVLAACDAEVVQMTGHPVHVVGYCSGGLVAMLRMAMRPAGHVASLTLVATPVDLQVAGGIFSVVRHPELRPSWALDGRGMVPAPVVREVFHLQRRIALRSALARRRLVGEEAAVFDALDRWLFHQRDLEGGIFFDLVDLARTNPLVVGGAIDGVAVDPSRITMPTLVALADRDHLVPAGSSLAARHVLPNTTLLDVPSGHVGMLASGSSPERLYGPVSRWIVAVHEATQG